jgi:DNA-binding NtrC family response regulator
VEQGSFRRDLFARLAFWEIHLPALRERRSDILLWLQRLFDGYRHKSGQKPQPLELAPDAAECVLLHAWPDNLRGIDRLAHRLSTSELAPPLARHALEQLLPELATVAPNSQAPGDATSGRAESRAPPGDKPPRPSPEELRSAYQETDGNVRALARRYERDRRQIYRWLKDLGIDRASDAPGRED